MPVDPHFVQEREAWYKAGASTMLGYAALSIFVVNVVVTYIAGYFDWDREQTTLLMTLGAWFGILVGNGLMILKAKRLARDGAIRVDRI